MSRRLWVETDPIKDGGFAPQRTVVRRGAKASS
jgi:hypothetical protein